VTKSKPDCVLELEAAVRAGQQIVLTGWRDFFKLGVD
jgi:hypothetical protein